MVSLWLSYTQAGHLETTPHADLKSLALMRRGSSMVLLASQSTRMGQSGEGEVVFCCFFSRCSA